MDKEWKLVNGRKQIKGYQSIFSSYIALVQLGKGSLSKPVQNAAGPSIHSCQVFRKEDWKMLTTGHTAEPLEFYRSGNPGEKNMYTRKNIFSNM